MCTDCQNKDVIKVIEKRLSDGEVIFAKIDSKLDEHTACLQRIESQVIKTNGRVTSLEDKDVSRQIEDARKSTIAEHSYTGKKLIRDIVAIVGFLGVLSGLALKVFG